MQSNDQRAFSRMGQPCVARLLGGKVLFLCPHSTFPTPPCVWNFSLGFHLWDWNIHSQVGRYCRWKELHTCLSIRTYGYQSRTLWERKNNLSLEGKGKKEEKSILGEKSRISGKGPQNQTQPASLVYSATWSFFWTPIFIVKKHF